MTTVLVANRGEVALRVFRTARTMGLRCVAVYSDADRDAPHVEAADVAFRIGRAPASESYLCPDRIVDAAREAEADLVHPGYGFLAEDPALARACEDAGLTFVGPPSSVLEAMGDKAEAKRLAREAGVPVLDGTEDTTAAAADALGYPLIVKPVAGGGGKGMAVASSTDELEPALAAARRIAQATFGDDRLLLERFLHRPRHIEVQVIADGTGDVVHLGERDCSVQRRHQKVLEETPAPGLDDEVRERLHTSAVALARRIHYRNAGTCEFLVGADRTIGFIEMNARLQVEHPVTELVTGIDLVELQLRVAMGERLPDMVARPRGHAIEVRVYAEDPEAGFLPQAGRIGHVRWPDDVRVDAGIEEGTSVTTDYDPMVAKVVVRGEDRQDAIASLRTALGGAEILGPRTNLPLLRALAAHPALEAGPVHTAWFEETFTTWAPERSPVARRRAALLAACAEADRVLAPSRKPEPFTRLSAWRIGGPEPVRVVVRAPDERVIEVAGSGPYLADAMTAIPTGEHHAWTIDGEPAAAHLADGWALWVDGLPWEVAIGPAVRNIEGTATEHLTSPLPGQVLDVLVAVGDHVTKGDGLVVVEAMKMEHTIRASADGVVSALRCRPGDRVDRGRTLLDVSPPED